MTFELTVPLCLDLVEGEVMVSKVTVAAHLKVRAYGMLRGRNVVVSANVWYSSLDELPVEAILKRFPSLHYSVRRVP